MTDAETRHYRIRRWRTLSEFLVLGTLLGLGTWAAAHGAPLQRAFLSQDLQDTPKGFQCLQRLGEVATGGAVRGFFGPFYGVDSNGTKDPTVAEFGVIPSGSTVERGRLRFFATAPYRWRYFSYGSPPFQKTGAYAPAMESTGEYLDGATGASVAVDFTPCLPYLISGRFR